MYSAELVKIVEAFQLVNILPEISLEGRVVKKKEVNRPALQLGGFYDSFDNDRIQVIGRVEHNFLLSLPEEKRRKIGSCGLNLQRALRQGASWENVSAAAVCAA